MDDIELLHAWRNDPQTRQASRKSGYVSWETHQAWLAKALVSSQHVVRIAEESGHPVGVVRADARPGGWELSWTVAPEARGRGIGHRIVQQFVKELKGSLIAVVGRCNVPSAKIAAAAGLIRAGPAEDPDFDLWTSGSQWSSEIL
jgi:RimJ/RimL family protein N-acetyltransferase